MMYCEEEKPSDSQVKQIYIVTSKYIPSRIMTIYLTHMYYIYICNAYSSEAVHYELNRKFCN